MLLAYRTKDFHIPRTSTCVILTSDKKVINDGDTVDVKSPVFSSINFSTGPLQNSEVFSVPVKVTNDEHRIETKGLEMRGTLICEDEDVNHMYVEI